MGLIEIFRVLNFLVLLGNIAVVKGADIRCYEGSPFTYSVYPLDELTPILSSPAYQPDRKTVFYIFGVDGGPDTEEVITVVQAYLDKANICLLNWEKEASTGILGPIAYALTAIPNAARVGTEFGKSLIELHNAGLNLADVHVIGFSLGGQLAGYTARKVQEYDNNLSRITGLDPAGLFYDGILSLRQLSASDASFIDIIHTNPGGLGSREASGTVDIWVNCGSSVQPGCNETSLGLLSKQNSCSHVRAWQYFAEAIESPYAFEARGASDCMAWKAGQGINQTIFMGEDIDTDARGNFYLRTNSYSFFGLGKEGSQPAI